MTVLEAIVRALLARYGAELLYRLLQQLAPEGSSPGDLQLAVRLEAIVSGGSRTRDPDQLDITDMDFEDSGYIWDRQPCRGE